MRSRIHAADKRLPNSIRALWYSDERRNRARQQTIQNTIAALNHDDDPEPDDKNPTNLNIAGNSCDVMAVFRARGTKNMSETPNGNTTEERPAQRVSGSGIRLSVDNADLSESTFADVNLANVEIKDARLTDAIIEDANLRGARLSNVNLTDVNIEDASIGGLTINGFAIQSLIERAATPITAERCQFESVNGIGNSDPMLIPVKDVGAAVAYYVNVFGFVLLSASRDQATLLRDSVTIGLSVSGADPDQASVYFAVSDIDSLHRELTTRSASPSALRIDTYGDRHYRVCFAKEPFGVCFCFGQKIVAPGS